MPSLRGPALARAMLLSALLLSPPLLSPGPAHAQYAALDVSPLVARLLPSVVNIAITHAAPPASDPAAARSRAPGRRSVGSGFVIGSTGLILTNRHVIEDAAEIVVTLHDGTVLGATVVAAAAARVDIAVLRVQPTAPLAVVAWGDSAALRQGQPVIAIGNPLGYGGTVTTGIVSALDRDIKASPYDMFVQTDASINPGSSSGPLFNLRGEVVGVNTAIGTTSQTAGSVGIGFAIPSNDAKFVVDRLLQHERLKLGWLPLKVHAPSAAVAAALGLPAPRGVIVTAVERPALAAILQPGDVILEVDGTAVADVRAFNRAIGIQPVGATARLRLWRDGAKAEVAVLVEDNPDDLRRPPHPSSRLATPHAPGAAAAQDLGLSLGPLTAEVRRRLGLSPDQPGVLIVDVLPVSQAAEQGLQPGEAVLRVRRDAVASAREFWVHVDAARRNRAVLLLVRGTQGDRWVALSAE